MFSSLSKGHFCAAIALMAAFFTFNSTAIAQSSDWSKTIAAVVQGDKLYTVESDGSLYKVDLSNGRYVRIGKPEFAKTKFIFDGPQNLYTIETDGTLYKVSPTDGAWSQVGEKGAYKNTLAGAFVGGFLYTVESNGGLYKTGPVNGQWTQIGKPDFANTKRLFSSSDGLYSIEADGSLYSIDPANGSWKRIGKAGGWKDTIARTTHGGKIYTVETSGALYVTDPATGTWKQIGKQEFGKTRFLFSANGMLYSLENGGLYRVDPATGAWSGVQ